MIKDTVHIQGFPYFPGVAEGCLQTDINGDKTDRILLITQADVTAINIVPAGFIVVDSVPFSHTMIGLLGLGVPTVLISKQQAELLEQGMQLAIDGDTGLISNELESSDQEKPRLKSGKAGEPVVMADGEPVKICASVRQPLAASQARALGAEAIGLVRSEFLLPDDNLVPDQAFYLTAFERICEAASPLTVTFRLLDIAADKMPPWLPKSDLIGQALGVQGVRLYNMEPVRQVINAQLAALLELSKTYSLQVLVPFLVRLEEFDYWLKIIRQQLPKHVPVGAMAETPAMVLDINHLLDDADFVAIGCNDLMQSVYAADRDQADLRYYLDPYSPMLFRLFKQISQQAYDRLHHVRLCGVLSQVRGVLPVLLGLGFREFSVDAPFIPYLADHLSKININECEIIADKVCAAKKTSEVLEILQLPLQVHPPFLI